MNALKTSLTVTAGLIPGQPDAKHTRQWLLSASDIEGYHQQHVMDAIGAAYAYALLLASTSGLNWVRTEYVYC